MQRTIMMGSTCKNVNFVYCVILLYLFRPMTLAIPFLFVLSCSNIEIRSNLIRIY